MLKRNTLTLRSKMRQVARNLANLIGDQINTNLLSLKKTNQHLFRLAKDSYRSLLS